MTHLERARAWMIDNWLWENRQEATDRLAALLAQVTNEALERAAGVTVLLDNQMSQRDVSYEIRKAIRSLKVSP